MIIKLLKTVLPTPIFDFGKRIKLFFKMGEWQKKGYGYPVPISHMVKQFTVRHYANMYHSTILVETGTYLGDMVEAQKANFELIVSIELNKELYQRAVERFKNDKNVSLYQGDSGIVLNQVMENINAPCIFWLDGHYSGGITSKGKKECPILEEIDAIFNKKRLNHVLLIDDARLFTGKNDYPTIEDLAKYVRTKNNSYNLKVEDDIIRFTID